MTVSLNPLYRFDTLVVGASNRLAVTAAKAVAESPGTVYNPLFVDARPGLGKTHLLMAIGHAARAINPRLAVEYLTLDEFVEAFHAAIAAGQGEAYRKRFLDVDLLLVDDVQFLTHRREMQAELLRLTDALQTASRQIVLTSDRPPAEIEALDERLIRRFAGGLIIDVGAPDYETRVAILRRKSEERRASFGAGVLEAVAGLEIDNVRELLGALNRLIAFQAVNEAPLTPGQASMLVGGEPDGDEVSPTQSADGGGQSPGPRSGPTVAPRSRGRDGAASPTAGEPRRPEAGVPGVAPAPFAPPLAGRAERSTPATATAAGLLQELSPAEPPLPGPDGRPASALAQEAAETRYPAADGGAVVAPAVVGAAAGADEFADFLSEIAATVAQQVDAWRSRVTAAVVRWQGEGYRTTSLEALLQQDMVSDPERALREFEEEVERLQSLQAEAAALSPELAGLAVFRDPDQVAAAAEVVRQAREDGHPVPAPSPLWQLDTLLETASNRVVLEAVRAVVAGPGDRYNPLVLVGGAATGKTHLLHALGNALAQEGELVACLSAPEFTSELIAAIDRDAVALWRARYRRATAFLLDDVHLIGLTDRTQDELFVLYNALIDAGHQLVFTSAVPLGELRGVEPRLRSRLEGGLVVELPPADPAVRACVLGRDLEHKLAVTDDELVSYLASRSSESLRAAQAVLQRVIDEAALRGVTPNIALARELLEPTPVAPKREQRSSGVLGAGAGAARSREKMVWEWPDLGDRLMEEWR